jgi:hypothetical protein
VASNTLQLQAVANNTLQLQAVANNTLQLLGSGQQYFATAWHAVPSNTLQRLSSGQTNFGSAQQYFATAWQWPTILCNCMAVANNTLQLHGSGQQHVARGFRGFSCKGVQFCTCKHVMPSGRWVAELHSSDKLVSWVRVLMWSGTSVRAPPCKDRRLLKLDRKAG